MALQPSAARPGAFLETASLIIEGQIDPAGLMPAPAALYGPDVYVFADEIIAELGLQHFVSN
ncbi:hypothetical protein ACFSC4_22020 [Deinococcus malanensis]|uniref:hypothetical protein n=1 Tax=Deinococcus malanensis TaxID=1706855 RepID=UPI00362D2461